MTSRQIISTFVLVLVLQSFQCMRPSADDITLKCLRETVIVQYEAAEKFNGTIYLTGHYKDESCRKNITDSNQTTFHVTIGTCGTANIDEHVVFDLTIIKHPKFITTDSRSFRANCSYNTWATVAIPIVYGPPSKTIYSQFIPEKSGRSTNLFGRKLCKSLLCKIRHLITNKLFSHQ